MPNIDNEKLMALANLVQQLVQSSETDERNSLQRPKRNFLKEARQELQRRSLKRSLFKDVEISCDWAWDILLELYVAHCTGAAINPTSAGTEAGIAQSTALRWIVALEASGLVRRKPDTLDKRRQWIGLSTEGVKRMESYLSLLG